MAAPDYTALHRTVWARYRRALGYTRSLSLTETVQKCEDFYIGDQWKGCEAADLDKPVINILKRVVTYFISSIVSDDIGIRLSRAGADKDEEALLHMLEDQLSAVMESAGVRRKLRQVLRDAAVDGDGCLHYWFDPSPAAGQDPCSTPGRIQAEVLCNYNVFFGNPQCGEVQSQPWLLVRYRRTLEDARRAARAAGLEDPERIRPDTGESTVNSEGEQGKVTVLRQYYKQGGTVWFLEAAADCLITPPTDTRCRLYPLVWMPWEPVKNRCYGKSAIAALIPNQIFINKLYAMAMRHVMMCAFPKVVYNRVLLPDGFSNRIGEAIPVNGTPDMAVGTGFRAPDMSTQVLQMISQVMQDTRDSMGASDASLGNVTPDNTSAIIATQKATAQPLELQKMAFYDLCEESVRIWLDLMAAGYGQRAVRVTPCSPGGDEEPVEILFDFSTLRERELNLQVDIGASTYWSEIMQTQTMDSLYSHGIITDPELYLECIPDSCLRGKSRLLAHVRQNRLNTGAGREVTAP